MEKNPKTYSVMNQVKNLIHQVALPTIFIFTTTMHNVHARPPESTNMPSAAETYIHEFRHNEDFHRPLKGLVINEEINQKELQILSKELATGTSQVREKLVNLLVEIDHQANRNKPQKDRLYSAQIIKLLSTIGLSKNDLGQAAAARELRNSCTHLELAPYGNTYTKVLGPSSDSELLLLIAKAKPSKARSEVEQLAMLSDWKGKDSVNIARAALGNTEIEDLYIKATNHATDGESLAHALEMLGFIGTTRSLRIVATYLRTPLKINVPNAFERTVRKDVLAALAYNFLDDAPFLLNVDTPEDYSAAEAFCTKKLGVVFEGPTPDIPPDRVFPIPLPKN